ncbi:MAG: cyclic nucleotide-binding domain-containing protein [Pelolinea sp.]|nr:cyclic nucleotide-binding domain-containing protein [Pelolinea sp.]
MNISRDELARIIRNVFPFIALENDHFDLILINSEVVYFPVGKMVYIEGTPSAYFYIIFKGQVEILKEKNHSLDQINVIGGQFAFGEDALINVQKRQTSARSITDVILIKIDPEMINQIREEDVVFNKNLAILVSSYKQLIRKTLPRTAEETIFYIGQPHKSIIILKSILTLITAFGIGILLIVMFNNGLLANRGLLWGGSILAGLSVLWMGWQFLEWSNDLFLFTDKRIINQQQALLSFETKQETPLIAIESLQARKSFFSRAFDFGDLEIRTFTGAMRLPFVPEIIYVEQIISHLMARSRNLVGEEEKQEFEKDIRERITMRTSGEQIEFSDDPDRTVNRSLESNDNQDEIDELGIYPDIVYHTHWTILFSKVFIPLTLFLAHVFLYIFLLFNQFAIINANIFNTIMAINGIFLICWSVYRYIDWKNDVYIISKDQLIDIDRRPFGMEEKRAAPIKNIQLIRYKRNGIFGLLFNYGTVFTRVGDEEFTFNNVRRPADVQEALFTAKDRYHRMEQEAEKQTQRKKAVDWIDSYHQVVKDLREDDQLDSKNGDR